jgi:hypothetical protein
MVSTLQDNRSQNQENITCFSELQNFKCVLTGDNDMLLEDSLSVVLNNADTLCTTCTFFGLTRLLIVCSPIQ